MVRDMFSAAGLGPLVRLNGKVNDNVHQNLLQQHTVLPLRASRNQPANFMLRDTLPNVSRSFR